MKQRMNEGFYFINKFMNDGKFLFAKLVTAYKAKIPVKKSGKAS